MKAILVIDMPENCSECSFEQNGICLAKSVAVESIDRPLWCPLKPMPQKKERELWDGRYTNYYLYRCGWNACIEEINATENGINEKNVALKGETE